MVEELFLARLGMAGVLEPYPRGAREEKAELARRNTRRLDLLLLY
jgi:hypothetical protein